MGQALRDHLGGILGLCDLLDEHGQAVEAHLIALGLRLRWLGTERLTWNDLRAIASQAGPRSAIGRALSEGWEVTDYLLAIIADHLAMANWQRQGKRGVPKPRPIPRPGDNRTERFGSDPIAIAEFDDWWREADSDE